MGRGAQCASAGRGIRVIFSIIMRKIPALVGQGHLEGTCERMRGRPSKGDLVSHGR